MENYNLDLFITSLVNRNVSRYGSSELYWKTFALNALQLIKKAYMNPLERYYQSEDFELRWDAVGAVSTIVPDSHQYRFIHDVGSFLAYGGADGLPDLWKQIFESEMHARGAKRYGPHFQVVSEWLENPDTAKRLLEAINYSTTFSNLFYLWQEEKEQSSRKEVEMASFSKASSVILIGPSNSRHPAAG